MNSSLGKIKIELSATKIEASRDLIDKLNQNIKPTTKLSVDDVHIRAMYIVSDKVNSYGGCFAVEDHQKLVRLLIDTPVLVGHRKDKLPIGRTFHAESVKRDDENWVKSYFYWLKAGERSTELVKNIDGGIFKECSLGFTYSLPECSLCGKDIRLCKHEPLLSYNMNGSTYQCFFFYRKIDRVLETSLVYRGAIENTKVTPVMMQETETENIISSLNQLNPELNYTVVPYYEGIKVQAEKVEGNFKLTSSCENLDLSIYENALDEQLLKVESCLNGKLVGYTGKKRCSIKDTIKFLKGEQSKVKQVILFLYPEYNYKNKFQSEILRQFPFRKIDYDLILKASREVMTKDGVELLYADDSKQTKLSRYLPDIISETKNVIKLLTDENDNYILSMNFNNDSRNFKVLQFDKERFDSGRKFIAELEMSLSKEMIERMNLFTTFPESYNYRTKEKISQTITIKPIRINGKYKYLIGKTNLVA